MPDARVTLRCACGREHTLDVAPDPGDERDALVVLRDGWGPLTGSTLAAWARSGRLCAWRAERGRLLAWERDLRAAVEREPYVATPEASTVRSVELGELAHDPDLERVAS
jgi:hypothetical protein